MEIQELQELCASMLEIRDKLADLDETKKGLNAELSVKKKIAVEMLEKHGLSNFDHGEGKIILNARRSVKIEDRNLFFQWLKENNMFEDSVSISSTTATRIYDEQFQKAQEESDIDFLTEGIPGLSEPNTFNDISFRKR